MPGCGRIWSIPLPVITSPHRNTVVLEVPRSTLRHPLDAGDRAARVALDLFQAIRARSGRRVVASAHRAFHQLKRPVGLSATASGGAPVRVGAAEVHTAATDLAAAKPLERVPADGAAQLDRLAAVTHRMSLAVPTPRLLSDLDRSNACARHHRSPMAAVCAGGAAPETSPALVDYSPADHRTE